MKLAEIVQNIKEDRDLWQRNHNKPDVLTNKGRDYAIGRIEAANYALRLLEDTS